MRKLLPILFVLICSSALAQGVPAPATPRLMVDSTGNLVGAANPLPTTSTIGSVTVTIPSNVAVTASSTNYTLTANLPWAITAAAARMILTIQNNGAETVWCLPGSTTATLSSGLPIPAGTSRSMCYSPAVPFAVIASAAQSICVVQDSQ